MNKAMNITEAKMQSPHIRGRQSRREKGIIKRNVLVCVCGCVGGVYNRQ